MLWTKLAIHIWIIMRIMRITKSQVRAMQSAGNNIYPKLNPMEKNYVYNADQLKYINTKVDHHRRLRILDSKAWVNIRKFRISRKKTRRGRKTGNAKYCETRTRSVNFDNPIAVARIQESEITRFTKHIKFVTLHVSHVFSLDYIIGN